MLSFQGWVLFINRKCWYFWSSSVGSGLGRNWVLELGVWEPWCFLSWLSKWQTVDSAQCVPLPNDFPVKNCFSPKNLLPIPNLLHAGKMPAQSSCVHTAQTGSSWGSAGPMKTRECCSSTGQPPCSRHNCLPSSWHIGPALGVLCLRLMMVTCHDLSPRKRIKWFPMYHSCDKAVTLHVKTSPCRTHFDFLWIWITWGDGM